MTKKAVLSTELGGEWFLTAQGVAEATGYPYRHLWTLVSRGTLPSPDVNLGNKPLWKQASVDNWLKQKEQNNG